MITPIALENEIKVIEQQLEQVKKVGAERFHIDIIDGLFADNITVVPADLQGMNFGNIKLDLHLLVNDPTDWIEECAAVKPARIFAQVERMGNIEYFIKTLKGWGGIEVGLALDLTTPIESLEDGILKQVGGVLLMSVKAGYSGQKFDERVIPRIEQLRKRYQGTILIDGGITPETYKEVVAAGASEAGANSALWKGNFADNFKKFAEAEKQWQRK